MSKQTCSSGYSSDNTSDFTNISAIPSEGKPNNNHKQQDHELDVGNVYAQIHEHDDIKDFEDKVMDFDSDFDTYVQCRLGSDRSEEGDGYVEPRSVAPQYDNESDRTEKENIYATYISSTTQDDIVCDCSGLLKDGHGYLILTNISGMREEKIYYRPVASPGRDAPYEYLSLPQKRRSRTLCIAMVCMTVLCLVSVGANVYLYLQKGNDTCNNDTYLKPDPTMCPRSMTYQAGSKVTLRCSLQIPTQMSVPTVDIFLVDDYESNRHNLLSQEQLPENGTLVKTAADLNANIEISIVGNNLIMIDVMYERIKCCNQGNLFINISGQLMVQIEVNVTADLECETNTQHTENTVNSLSCTRCICGSPTPPELPLGAWIYNHDNSSNVTQPGRVTFDQAFDENTDLITYRLVFNETACFDGGEYSLILTEAYSTHSQINFTLQITGALSMTRTIRLLTRNSVMDLGALCISNSRHDAYLSNQSVTYTFLGDDASLEVLQAENSSVVSNARYATIGFIPAFHQTVNIDTYRDNSIQFRSTFGYGILNLVVIFDSVQCYHSGYYQFFVDNVLLRNLTVLVDDTGERTETTIHQKSEETGFVEMYNITMECAAIVGCTKRPFIIDNEINDANTTYSYSLVDRNSDSIMDFFVATITSNVVNISMTLNNTDFTCSVTDDAITKALTYTIYVLEATFCETRPVNCEYFYPYRTEPTCKLWVSCLNDRPRVKMCHNNLFYNKNDNQCSGICDYQCPRNL